MEDKYNYDDNEWTDNDDDDYAIFRDTKWKPPSEWLSEPRDAGCSKSLDPDMPPPVVAGKRVAGREQPREENIRRGTTEGKEKELPRVESDPPEGYFGGEPFSVEGVTPLESKREAALDRKSRLMIRSVEVIVPPRDRVRSKKREDLSPCGPGAPPPLSREGGMAFGARAKRARGTSAAPEGPSGVPPRGVSGGLIVAEGGGEALASPEDETDYGEDSPPHKRSGGPLTEDQRRRYVEEARVFRGNAGSVASAARKWLDEIDRSRRETPTMRESASGRFKVSSLLVGEAIANLLERLACEESRSDSLANEEGSLRAQVDILEGEVRRLRGELDKTSSALENLQRRIVSPGIREAPGEVNCKADTDRGEDRSTPILEGGLADAINKLVRRLEALEVKIVSGMATGGGTPIQETSGPTLPVEDARTVTTDVRRNEDTVRSRQRRKSLRRTVLEASVVRRKSEGETGPTYAAMVARPLPRIVPRDGGGATGMDPKKAIVIASPSPPPETRAPRLGRGRRRRGSRGALNGDDGARPGGGVCRDAVPDSDLPRGEQETGKTEDRAARIRLPTSAAVLIIAEDRQTYGGLLSEARSSIKLDELGVYAVRSRQSRAGDILLEVPGKDSSAAADRLAGRLRLLFEGRRGVQVIRPRPRLDVWVGGCEVHATSGTVAAAVAAAGGCAEGDVRVTPAGVSRSGRTAFWASCPASAAMSAVKGGWISLGWERARVEISRGRPLRCFRCLAGGHTQRRCPSRTERARSCFNCGEEGHGRDECLREAHCPVCEERNLPAGHRAGAANCPPVPPGPFRTGTTLSAGPSGDAGGALRVSAGVSPPSGDTEPVVDPLGPSEPDSGAVAEFEEVLVAMEVREDEDAGSEAVTPDIRACDV